MPGDEFSAPARRASVPVRAALVLVGGAVLLVSGIGAYLALAPTVRDRPVATIQPPKGFVFRTHPAPRALPNVAFEDGAGRKLTLADFRGKFLLLNLWATWCPPCRKEMPALDRLERQLGGPTFQVVALSIDLGGASAIRPFYEEADIRALALYADPSGQVASRLGAVGIPTTLLIDAAGREIGRVTGPAEWDSPEVVATIRRHLGAGTR